MQCTDCVLTMKLSEFINALGLKVLTKSEYDDREITGGYAGDLLSWVMGRAQSGNVWVTIMSNINSVAVAALTDATCILLSEGVVPEQEVIDKANAQDVVILSSELSTYELACKLHEISGV